MSKKKSPLTDEDRALWKSVSDLVEPHKKTQAHRKKRMHKADEPVPPALAKKTTRKNWHALEHQGAAAPLKQQTHAHELPALAADVADRIKSRKRGIDARLDCHGMTQDVAHRKAIAFVNACYARHLKTVLIITGKGSASGSEGVLQKNMGRWLAADVSTAKLISGISSAPRELGGSGACVITLKRPNKN